jgi:hypothetical protein
MRKSIYWVFILLFIFFTACRKQEQHFNLQSGNHIWIGTGGENSGPFPPDAFTQFSVVVVDNKTIVANDDTLTYRSSDGSIMKFEFDPPYSHYPNLNYSIVYYNTKDNTMEYSYSIGSSMGDAFMKLSTAVYKPNKLLHTYLPNLTGIKKLAGTVYDTFMLRQPNDSLYTLNFKITFRAIDDSTIVFDNNILGLYDSVLHYKVTDAAAKTVTFQTFHTEVYNISTLTYNYDTQKIVFEQQDRSGGWLRYLRSE